MILENRNAVISRAAPTAKDVLDAIEELRGMNCDNACWVRWSANKPSLASPSTPLCANGGFAPMPPTAHPAPPALGGHAEVIDTPRQRVKG